MLSSHVSGSNTTPVGTAAVHGRVHIAHVRFCLPNSLIISPDHITDEDELLMIR